jgi:hypothetical protein
VGNKKRREEKSSRRLSLAPKEHGKLASYEVAGLKSKMTSCRKARWKWLDIFHRPFQDELHSTDFPATS